jgi:chromatin segregation and condensation protein Rec8/ScpA/Scc1 (kleisin family)
VKADYLSEHMQDELVDRLKGRLDYLAARELIADWAKGDAGAIRAVDATLAERGLSVSSITARTFAERFDVLDRFNQFLANAEARRNNALHEIQRHRLFLAEQLRRVVEEIDAQPAEVEALSQQKSQAAE